MTARKTPPERRSGGRPPKHGGRMLAKHLAAGELDQRSWIARVLRDVKNGIAQEHGGWEKVGYTKALFIDTTASQVLIVNAMRNWILQQESPVTRDGEALSILKKGYQTAAANLSRNLLALGLDPARGDELPNLSDYIAERTNGSQDAQNRPRIDESDGARTLASTEPSTQHSENTAKVGR